ncbi:zinc finger MYM-type protein 1-like [Dendronephthya gigantea]|uniref:zinc finger MYM-type protein 1-like n=1 Tax=Dendronephthya gigantea TaxID=151771 RepID=UPI00106A7AB3|nr:zinc finger MYM-type protein 1-like [Dendronephthya gigantea]
MTTKDDDLQYDIIQPGTESSGSKDFAATVSFDEDLPDKNVKELVSKGPITAFIDDVELNALSQLRENSEQNTVTDSENVTPESMTMSSILAATPMDDLSSPAHILDEQPEKVVLSNTDGLSRYLQRKQMDVVMAKKSVDGVIKTLSECRTQENFDLLWSRAEIMADKIKEQIEGADFNFKDAKVPRLKQPSRRLQTLVGEMPEVNAEVEYRTVEDHYRITCYYLSIDRIVAEMKYRFEGNDQEVLLALADIVFSSSPTMKNIELVSDFYSIDSELLGSEKNVYENIDADNPDPERKNAAEIVRKMFENGVHEVLPVAYKVFSILATIPATSCSAERSFSALRRLKTYLRSTMGQKRLNSIALINIERAYANSTLKNDMEKIIDIFGQRRNRKSYFF